jgi:hypothetical protein
MDLSTLLNEYSNPSITAFCLEIGASFDPIEAEIHLHRELSLASLRQLRRVLRKLKSETRLPVLFPINDCCMFHAAPANAREPCDGREAGTRRHECRLHSSVGLRGRIDGKYDRIVAMLTSLEDNDGVVTMRIDGASVDTVAARNRTPVKPAVVREVFCEQGGDAESDHETNQPLVSPLGISTGTAWTLSSADAATGSLFGAPVRASPLCCQVARMTLTSTTVRAR